jgi:hypothetical protein
LAKVLNKQSRKLIIKRLKLSKNKETQELQLLICKKRMEQRLRELQAIPKTLVSSNPVFFLILIWNKSAEKLKTDLILRIKCCIFAFCKFER